MKEKIINNILVWTVIIIIMNLLISFVFVSPYIDYKSEQYAYSSFYDNLQLDFNIPSPSRDQINELRRLNFIEKVIPYYYVGLDVNYSGNKRDSNILFFENMEDLKYIFSDNMEIYKGIESQNAILMLRDPKASVKFQQSQEFAQNADSVNANPLKALGYKLYRTFSMIRSNDQMPQNESKQFVAMA